MIPKQKQKERPGCFDFNYDGSQKKVEVSLNKLVDKEEKGTLRMLDPWALSYVEEKKAQKQFVRTITLNINYIKLVRSNINFEAFMRRVSFLQINNPLLKFEVKLNNERADLYDTRSDLFIRPSSEIIREKINSREDDDTAGRLEKDLQVFLYGRGLHDKDSMKKAERTNERLALLGEDFVYLKGKKMPILREFPTGVFTENISSKSRMLPTEFVDIVTLNKHKQLSVIELKINDPRLEVVSQLLDYSLYFRSYYDKLMNMSVFKSFKLPGKANIICYVANNRYHPRFSGIMKYYVTTGKNYGFELKKITLGETAFFC